jgi:hypothetical protein
MIWQASCFPRVGKINEWRLSLVDARAARFFSEYRKALSEYLRSKGWKYRTL